MKRSVRLGTWDLLAGAKLVAYTADTSTGSITWRSEPSYSDHTGVAELRIPSRLSSGVIYVYASAYGIDAQGSRTKLDELGGDAVHTVGDGDVIGGTVNDALGRPVPDAEVRLVAVATERYRWDGNRPSGLWAHPVVRADFVTAVRADDEGRYVIQGVRERWRFGQAMWVPVARDAEGRWWRGDASFREERSDPCEIDIRLGRSRWIDFDDPGRIVADIRGRVVRDPGGEAVQGALVTLVGENLDDAVAAVVTTEPDGAFHLVRAMASAPTAVTVCADGIVTVAAAVPGVPSLIRLPPARPGSLPSGVRGVLRDFAGRPASGVRTLTCTDVFGQAVDVQVAADEDGRFVVPGLAPGPWHVECAEIAGSEWVLVPPGDYAEVRVNGSAEPRDPRGEDPAVPLGDALSRARAEFQALSDEIEETRKLCRFWPAPEWGEPGDRARLFEYFDREARLRSLQHAELRSRPRVAVTVSDLPAGAVWIEARGQKERWRAVAIDGVARLAALRPGRYVIDIAMAGTDRRRIERDVRPSDGSSDAVVSATEPTDER